MKGKIIAITTMLPMAITSCTKQEHNIVTNPDKVLNIVQVTSEDEDAKILMKSKHSNGMVVSNPSFMLDNGVNVITFSGNENGEAEINVPADVYDVYVNSVSVDSVNGVATSIITVLQTSEVQTFTVVLP